LNRSHSARLHSPARRLEEVGFGWRLMRLPGYHTGEYFLKVNRPLDLGKTVRSLPGRDLLAIEFVVTSDARGKIRKYRVLTIDGQPFPLHLAVAKHWMVHFPTADMPDSPEHRAEDARFLEDMPGALGPDVMAALGRIAETMSLDYGGVDFSLDRDGQVVVWEANATMVAPAPSSEARWDYRRPAVARVHSAVRRMLLRRAGEGA